MISFDGNPLLLPDPDGELVEFLNRYLAVEEARIFSPPYACHSGRFDTRVNHATPVGIGRPNYPAGPPPRINQLYWPTGASRWAYGCFLCTGDVRRKLDSALTGAENTAGTLKLGETDEKGISTSMYMLEPRPLSTIMPQAVQAVAEELWLLPLVDARYWWQFRNTGDLSVTSSTTWGSLFSSIGSGLGVTINNVTPVAAYLNPDPEECVRRYDNAAVLLDAVAHSVGQRVVRRIDGTVRTSSWSGSDDRLKENLALSWSKIAGDLVPNDIFTTSRTIGPEQVTVVFRKYIHHRPYGNGAVWTKDTAPDESVESKVSGTRKTIHTTCYANFTTGSGNPDNLAKLNSLAAQIASDYCKSLAKRYDVTFAGVLPWESTGYCDHTLWSVGAQRPDGSYECQTRVQSVSHNFGVEEMLHQDPDLEVIGPVQVVKGNASIASGQLGDCRVWRNGGEGSNAFVATDPAVTIKALNLGNENVAAARFLQVKWHEDANVWLIDFEAC